MESINYSSVLFGESDILMRLNFVYSKKGMKQICFIIPIIFAEI